MPHWGCNLGKIDDWVRANPSTNQDFSGDNFFYLSVTVNYIEEKKMIATKTTHSYHIHRADNGMKEIYQRYKKVTPVSRQIRNPFHPLILPNRGRPKLLTAPGWK